MKRFRTTAMGICAAVLLARAAHAQVALDSVRIAAKDTVALAKFYQAALGIALVQTRVTLPNVVSFAAGECRQWSSGKGSVPEFRHSQFLIPELARLELALLNLLG